MKNCSLCHKPIILSPSASERAKKYGNTPAYYENLFTMHSDCQLKEWYIKPLYKPKYPYLRGV